MAVNRELQAFMFRSVLANSRLEELHEEGLLPASPATTSRRDSHFASSFSPDDQVRARRMGQAYELLYFFENSVRELVEGTLRDHFGPEKWWQDGIPPAIQKQVAKRKAADLKARWHSPRGESPINYVDFPQYAEIIADQWELFEVLLGDADWVTYYFNELNVTRRALAHTGSVSDVDVARMELRIEDWLRVVG